MSWMNVHSVWALIWCPRKLRSGAQTLCMAILLFAFGLNEARADCPAAPLTNPEDLAISFLAANGSQAAPGTLMPSTVKEGTLVYDEAVAALKICDGTNWIGVGSGGTDTLASLSCSSGQIAKYNGTVWACAADGGGAAGSVQTATQSTSPMVLGDGVLTDTATLTVATSGTYSIMARGYNVAVAPWLYFSSNCYLVVNGVQVQFSPFYYGSHDASTGSSAFFPHSLHHVASLTAGQIVKTNCLSTSNSTTRHAYAWRIDLVPVGGGADTLTGLSCSNGQIPKWNGTAWACAADGGGSGGAQVAFGVRKNTDQTVTSSSFTKLTWQTENFDTNNNFTADRFTATIAGKYIFTANAYCTNTTNNCIVALYKNGSNYVQSGDTGAAGGMGHVTAVIDMNVGDYLEAHIWPGSGTTVRGLSADTHFSGALLGGGSSDTLAGLSCSANQIPKWNGTAWACATDDSGSGSSTEPPRFSAFRSGNQTVATNTPVKLLFNTEEFDSNNNFDTATGRFTPTVAGTYMLLANTFCPDATTWCQVRIYRNGSEVVESGSFGSNDLPTTTALVSMNGTTDYVEAYVYNGGGTTVGGAAQWTRFSGFKVGGGSSQWTTVGNDLHYGTGGVAIGQASAPDASSILELESTTKGLLLPRLTTAQVGSVSSPADGLVVYDADVDALKVRANGAWVTVGASGGGTGPYLRLSYGAGTLDRANVIPFAVSENGGGASWAANKFTAVTPGVYFVTVNGYALGQWDMAFSIRKNGTDIVNSYGGASNAGKRGGASGSAVTYLNAGDYIDFFYNHDTGGIFLNAAYAAISYLGAGSSGGGTPAPSNGYVQFNNASAFGGDANLFWDNTNKRLGIGTTTPGEKLQVAGAIKSTGTAVTLLASSTAIDNLSGTTARLISVGPNAATAGGFHFNAASSDNSINFNPLVILPNGNVGIGLTSPTFKLQVAGGGTSGLYIQDTVGTTRGIQIGGTGGLGTVNYTGGPSDEYRLFNTANGFLTLGTNNTERMRITAAGNVGIGTTSPGTLLNGSGTAIASPLLLDVRPGTTQYGGVVVGSSRTLGATVYRHGYFLRRNDEWQATNNGLWTGYSNTGADSEYWENVILSSAGGGANLVLMTGTASPSERMRITPNGNVGIGTTTPVAALHIKGAEAGIFLEETGGGANNEAYLVHYNNTFAIQNRTSAGGSPIVPYQFDIRAPHSTIATTSTGNVGLGTTPDVKLTVQDSQAAGFVARFKNTANATGASGIIIEASSASSAGGAALIQFLRSGGTAIGSVTHNGLGTVSYNTTSDARLKEHIVPTATGLSTLMKIQVRDYNYLGQQNRTEQGFIAQELHEAYPQVVKVGGADAKKDPWSIDYGKLTPLLVKAVQDLKADNDNLRAELKAANDNDAEAIEELRREINALKAAK